MIKYNNMSYSYTKSKIVLNNIDFTINKGDIHGLLGHNGAGKSTLFKLTLGLLKPISGEIILNLGNKKTNISYMPEVGGIYEKLTARQNLEFRARSCHTPKEKMQVMIENILNKLKLINRADEPVSLWSNGMKKRLSLACAIISNPDIILLDEPTNGIDPESLLILIDVLKEINKNGSTIVIISHNLDFIQKITSKISILQHGKLIYHGNTNDCSVEDIYIKKIKEDGEI